MADWKCWLAGVAFPFRALGSVAGAAAAGAKGLAGVAL